MISPGTVLTVGHSTHSLPRFIELLTQHGVTAVADVRSTPASRFSSQFNRASLSDALQGAGIGYAFIGLELGARSNDPGCYVNGKVRYERLAATAAFAEGIQRLNTGAGRTGLP